MPTPVNVWDYERLAEEKLDANALAYFAGGAGDEVTLRENVAAFERLKLRPRVLVDLGSVATKTTVLGNEISLPVLIAPLAMQRMAHPDGELATARAAAAAGTILCVSSAATARPVEIAEAAPGCVRWFQVYVFADRAVTLDLVEERPVITLRGQQFIGHGKNVLGDPRLALTWLANELRQLGVTLKAGRVVTTGTCHAPLPIQSSDFFAADFGSLGKVSVGFE